MTAASEPNSRDRTGITPAIRLLLVLIVPAVLVAGGVWILFPPKYHSKACIRIDSLYPGAPRKLRPELVPTDVMNRWVRDQAILMKDESVLREVIIDPNVRSTAWFSSQPGGMEAFELLKNKLRAEPCPDSSVIKLSFATDNPKDAATIVNTVVEKHLDRVQGMAHMVYKQQLTDYRVMRERLDQNLDSLLQAKKEFLSQRLAAHGVTERFDLIGERLRTLTAEETRLDQETQRAKFAYETLTGSGSSDIGAKPPLPSGIVQDPEVTHLRDLKLSLEIELESAAATQPESRAPDDGLRRKLKVVERTLSEMLDRKHEEARSDQVEWAHREYLAALQQRTILQERIVELQAKQRDVDLALVEYRKLEDSESLIRKELAEVHEHMNQLNLILRDRGVVQITRFLATPSESRDLDFQVKTSLAALAIPVAYGLLLLCIRIIRGPRCVTVSRSEASLSERV